MGKAVIVYIFPEPEDDMEIGSIIEKAQEVFPKGEARKIYMGVNTIADAVFDIFNPGETVEESNLVSHARVELELLGENDEWYVEGIIKVIQAFADMGHSGGSASLAIPTISSLLQYKNLTPLTDNPDEWLDRTEESGGQPLWQSKRNPGAFSTNGGRTYYMIDDLEKIQHETNRMYK